MKSIRALPYPVRHYTDAEIDEFIAKDTKDVKAIRRRDKIKKPKIVSPKELIEVTTN